MTPKVNVNVMSRREKARAHRDEGKTARARICPTELARWLAAIGGCLHDTNNNHCGEGKLSASNQKRCLLLLKTSPTIQYRSYILTLQLRFQLLILPKSLGPYALLPGAQNAFRIKRIFDCLHEPAIRMVVEVVKRSHHIYSLLV